MRVPALVLVSVVVLAGCDSVLGISDRPFGGGDGSGDGGIPGDASILGTDSSGLDATTGSDAGDGQDADDAGGCPVNTMACGGHCVSSQDVHNCGVCGHDCTTLPNATSATCNAGECSYQCTPGHVDCSDAGAGCADTLTASPNCGACGVACSGTTPNCSSTGDAGVHACVASCASSMGTGCGSCGGTVKCDGTCSVATPGNYGTGCGSCGGTVKCDSTCSVATPGNYGTGCGSCGGTVKCDGTCSVPTPSNYGTACGCGGTIRCDGSCSASSLTGVLASGTLVASASRANSVTVSIPCPATITSVTTWSGGGTVVSFFKHVNSTNYGYASGASVLTAPSFQVAAADVALGTTWTFYVTSGDSVDHTVSYTITAK